MNLTFVGLMVSLGCKLSEVIPCGGRDKVKAFHISEESLCGAIITPNFLCMSKTK